MAVLFILIRHAWGLSGQSALVLRIPGFGHFSLAPFVDMMSSGIDLFFVLSAYLLSQQFLRANFSGEGEARSPALLPNPVPAHRPSLLGGPGPDAPPVHAHADLPVARVQQPGTGSGAPPCGISADRMVRLLRHLEHCDALLDADHRGDVLRGAALRSCRCSTITGRCGWVSRSHWRRPLVWLVLCRWSLGPLVNFVTLHSGGAWRPATWCALLADAADPSFRLRLRDGHRDGQPRRSASARCAARSPVDFTDSRHHLRGRGFTALALVSLCGALAFRPSPISSTSVGQWSRQRPARLPLLLLQPAPLRIGLRTPYWWGLPRGIAPLRRIFSISPLALFGVLGYSIYLIHMQLLYHFNSFPSIFFAATPRAHFLKLFFAAYSGDPRPCSLGMYLAVERPFIFRSRASSQDPLHAASRGAASAPEPPQPVAPAAAPEPARPASEVVSGSGTRAVAGRPGP